MPISSILQSFLIRNKSIGIFVPDPDELVEEFKTQKRAPTAFYWAKVWPAAIGLCTFLQDNLHYIKNKNILELAAGPGLPGIFSAAHASSVCISDVEPKAVALVQQSVALHQLTNVCCQVIDWNDLTGVTIPETVLLSDINYEPTQFKKLFTIIDYLLINHCTIILSTPQRLMAKDFINQLLMHCKDQATVDVEMDGKQTAISVFVLKQ